MKNLKKIALSLHCITLVAICQVFWPISPVFATDTPVTNTQIAANVAANPQSFKFESYEADYYLSQDQEGISHLWVVENLTAIFPNFDQNHGITRVIPFTNQAGVNLTISDLDHFTVQAKLNGAPIYPYSVERNDGYFEVLLGDPDTYVHGRQVYTLAYEFDRVITDFEDHQELYWDTNGVDWSQAFDALTVRIHLEDQLADHYTGKAWCYTGRQGSTAQDCAISQDANIITVKSNRRLAAHENLTFDLEFQPDTFTVPRPKQNYILLIFFIVVGLIGLALLSFAGYVIHRTSAKRKYYKQLFVKPEYAPPAGLTVAEAAECSMRQLISNSKVATLIELAVQGKVDLIQNQSAQSKRPVWTIRIKSNNFTGDQGLVLRILRGKDAPLVVGEEFLLKNHSSNSTLTRLVERFPKTVKHQVWQKGLLESDSSKSKQSSPLEKLCERLAGASAFWAFFGAVALALVESSLPDYGLIFGHSGQGFGWLDGCIIGVLAGVFLFTLITSIFCSRYAVRTEKGLQTARYLEGLKLYIKMAEAERLKFLQSVKGVDTSHQGIVKLYEKLLPYAIIFGLETSWLKEMSHYYEYADVSAPTWYLGYGTFSAQAFNQAIRSATTSANSSFVSASPSNSSSGGSGGGGGGFSGGGGGGGGGGGW